MASCPGVWVPCSFVSTRGLSPCFNCRFFGFTARVEDGDQPLSIRVVGYWILFILLGAAGARVSRWNEQALEHGGRSIPLSSLAPPLAPHAQPLRLRENVH